MAAAVRAAASQQGSGLPLPAGHCGTAVRGLGQWALLAGLAGAVWLGNHAGTERTGWQSVGCIGLLDGGVMTCYGTVVQDAV